MHEHSIVDALLGELNKRCLKENLSQLEEVTLLLGPYSAHKESHIKEAFEHIQHHHSSDFPFIKDTTLLIETLTPHTICPNCLSIYDEDQAGAFCPNCNKANLELPQTLLELNIAEVKGR